MCFNQGVTGIYRGKCARAPPPGGISRGEPTLVLGGKQKLTNDSIGCRKK